METLSQASEELKAQCHNDISDVGGTKTEEYLRINHSDINGIDDIEIYEVSEGSEASVEVNYFYLFESCISDRSKQIFYLTDKPQTYKILKIRRSVY